LLKPLVFFLLTFIISGMFHGPSGHSQTKNHYRRQQRITNFKFYSIAFVPS